MDDAVGVDVLRNTINSGQARSQRCPLEEANSQGLFGAGAACAQ